MEKSVLTTVVLPLALFLIMLGMGMSLVPDDFKRVLRYPKAAIIGLFNQMILLPIVGFGLVKVFALDPMLAVGMMIIAACPGGVTSNLITHVCKGDAALSITLTAINSVLTVITIPLIVSWSLGHFTGASQAIELPVIKTILQIFAITILPVGLGMLIRHFKPDLAKRLDRGARIASSVIFIVIVIGLVAKNIALLKTHFTSLASVTIALNLSTMAIGFIIAKLAKLKLPQTLAITIESGVQNGTLAIVIATTILNKGDLALPGAIYSLVMFATGGLLMAYFGLIRKSDDTAPQPATT